MLNMIHRLMLIALVAVVGASSTLILAQQKSAQQKSKSGLHARAKSAGGKLVWRYKPTKSVLYPNVEELAKRSDLVIVGRTLAHRSSLTADGRFITQDFLVRVQEVFKGEVKNGSSMIVSLPGGSYKFDDGTRVHVMPIGYKQAVDGASYVFFLRENFKEAKQGKSSIHKRHRLSSEIQGLFALQDTKVEPAYADLSDPIAQKYQGMDAMTFLQQLRKVVSSAGKK